MSDIRKWKEIDTVPSLFSRYRPLARQISETIVHLVKQAWNLACRLRMPNYFEKYRCLAENSKWRTKWPPFSKWPPWKNTDHSLLSKTSLHWLIFRFLVSMSMFKNPLNLNFYLIFIMADKMAAIFKMAVIEGLNYSFHLTIHCIDRFWCFWCQNVCKWTYRIWIYT